MRFILPGEILQGAILARGFFAGMWREYPFFYVQLVCALIAGLLGDFAYLRYFPSPRYAEWYWSAELGSMVVASLIFLDILRNTLEMHAATRRIGSVIRLILGVAVFTLLAFVARDAPRESGMAGTLAERGFRSFEALLLAVIIIVMIRHRLPVGKNIKGMILGYGAYLGTVAIFFALATRLGYSPMHRWIWTPGLGYNLALLIWLISLRKHRPDPDSVTALSPKSTVRKLDQTSLARQVQA